MARKEAKDEVKKMGQFFQEKDRGKPGKWWQGWQTLDYNIALAAPPRMAEPKEKPQRCSDN